MDYVCSPCTGEMGMGCLNRELNSKMYRLLEAGYLVSHALNLPGCALC